MICKKCNNVIDNNYKGNTCPHCGSPLKKGYRSKFVSSERLKDAGTDIAKSSFIQLKRVNNKKDVKLKDYNNYIDYKSAKEANDDSKYYSIYANKATSNETGAKKSKAKYVRKKASPKPATNTIYVKKKDISQPVDSTFRNTGKSYYNELIHEKKDRREFATGDIGTPEEQPIFYPQPDLNYIQVDSPRPQAIKVGIDYKGRKGFSRLFSAICLLSLIGIMAVFFYKSYANNGYYFGENKGHISEGVVNTTVIDDEMLQYEGVSKSGQKGGESGVGITSIVYDNQYFEQMTFNSLNDVLRLVASDSNRQKDNCLQSVIAVENEIISNYGITAVNFCEMDVQFARELKEVVKYMYNTFPQTRNYLTNITLANVDNATYIAAFMPVFTFGTSKTNNKYPVAIKSQIILNAKYFLNNSKINSSVNYGVKSGYFPPNATRSSTVAHEFGHYLSYIALLNNYHSGRLNFVKASDADTLFTVYDDFNAGNFSFKLLQEAYQRYRATYGNNLTFDQFRETISVYAIAKDKSGAYIYDETIAEAFHDCYLNGNSAQPASKVIVEVLKGYL